MELHQGSRRVQGGRLAAPLEELEGGRLEVGERDVELARELGESWEVAGEVP